MQWSDYRLEEGGDVTRLQAIVAPGCTTGGLTGRCLDCPPVSSIISYQLYEFLPVKLLHASIGATSVPRAIPYMFKVYQD
jgi:hypothetical protein